MNLKRIIDRNSKLIWYIILIVALTLLTIKSLNAYYEKLEEKKLGEVVNNTVNEPNSQSTINFTTESNSIETTMSSFVTYCNNRELEKAYSMLTEECKNAMFPTLDYFNTLYVNNVYNEKRTYDLTRWSTNGNMITYLATLHRDLLATGGIDNSIQEYYTFVEDENGNYKLNINDYIYGKDLNIEKTQDNINVKITHIDVYEEFPRFKITITNNSSKTICLTGNGNKNNIYLLSSNDTKFSSINSKFDRSEDITLRPGKTESFNVNFNKTYSLDNVARYLVLNDIILDYEDYIVCEDTDNYTNRTSIKISL